MAFMRAEMTDKGTWHEVDGAQGISWYPGEYFTLAQAKDDYAAGAKDEAIYDSRTIKGYGVRCSAPGYMDCTDWEVYETESDAYDRFCELEAELREGEDTHRVTLCENKGDAHTIIFECVADDDEHAKEQAENAYPNAEIVSVACV